MDLSKGRNGGEQKVRRGALAAGIIGLIVGLILFGVAAAIGSGAGFVASATVGGILVVAGVVGAAYGARR